MSTTTRAPEQAAGNRADVTAAAAALGLFAVAAVVGWVLYLNGAPVRVGSPPLLGEWGPRVGPGTPLALALAGLGVWRGPDLAARLPWRRLLVAAYVAAVGWIGCLALVDGWQGGVASRLTASGEYLEEVGRVTDVPAMLREFTSHILSGPADAWVTHVAGHPPGALLVFVGLDRIGLGGGAWAAVVCILVAALTAVAVPQTVRLLDGDSDAAARAVVPFAVLFPGAVWMGVSADGLFAGVTATGIALIAAGLVRNAVGPALLGGVLVGYGAYLSYGLVLVAVLVLAVVVAARRWRPLLWSAAGAGLVVAAFTAAGFWWFDGYHLVVERYYQGIASDRAYAYWVWANLAVLAVSAGPAAFAIVRRAVLARSVLVACVLPLGAALAIVAADLSGLSKAEVERIWLPFAVWSVAGAVLLPAPSRRWWLAAQVTVALLVNHLILTLW